jgi:hypothetical protein
MLQAGIETILAGADLEPHSIVFAVTAVDRGEGFYNLLRLRRRRKYTREAMNNC